MKTKSQNSETTAIGIINSNAAGIDIGGSSHFVAVPKDRDPKKLSQMRDFRCKNNEEVIEKSLQGNYREEHLFTLQQAVEIYDSYQEKIKECDEEIKKNFKS